ncbi:unnamed protein product [Allacma fusca]|uniref:Uncharacterized protein n=1 Tax=Allacma fusca TaxID=39272 RepID=A0A8J2Q1T3_9HEXA|nr:unnamed protein product [Allacma fusca]
MQRTSDSELRLAYQQTVKRLSSNSGLVPMNMELIFFWLSLQSKLWAIKDPFCEGQNQIYLYAVKFTPDICFVTTSSLPTSAI